MRQKSFTGLASGDYFFLLKKFHLKNEMKEYFQNKNSFNV
jgi:hypothetical protein